MASMVFRLSPKARSFVLAFVTLAASTGAWSLSESHLRDQILLERWPQSYEAIFKGLGFLKPTGQEDPKLLRLPIQQDTRGSLWLRSDMRAILFFGVGETEPQLFIDTLPRSPVKSRKWLHCGHGWEGFMNLLEALAERPPPAPSRKPAAASREQRF
jgi:hypothetical protein